VGKAKLRDSLTEMQFRNVLAYVISKMRCGHTSARLSRAAQDAPVQNSSFPFIHQSLARYGDGHG
jgi:hypothetical protein